MKVEDVKFMEGLLDTCPFCGKSVEIAIRDYEGNPRDLYYLQDPWSGLSFSISHRENKDCILNANPSDWEYVGHKLYYNIDELVDAWNTRKAGGAK